MAENNNKPQVRVRIKISFMWDRFLSYRVQKAFV